MPLTAQRGGDMMKKKSTLRRLFSYVKPHLGLVILALLTAVVGVALTLLAPILTGNAIDKLAGINNVDFPALYTILTVLTVSVLVSAASQWLMNICTSIISYKVVRNLRADVFDKLHRIPLRYIDTNSHGDLISRVVNDIDSVADGLLQGIAQFLVGVLTILGTIAFMFSINVTVAIVVVVLTPMSLFVAWFIAKFTHSAFTEQSRIQGELSGYAEELIGNGNIVTAFAYEERASAHYSEINARLRKAGVRAQWFSSLTNPSTRFVNAMVYAIAAVMGCFVAITAGTISVGAISSFLTYATQYTKPFNEITGVITQLQSALASAARVFAVIDEDDETPDGEYEILQDECKGSVTLENVDFSYVPERPLIQDFNLAVAPGKRVAIVGPTGCGKTTLINLLMRFYDVTDGKISVEGHDVKSLKRSSLRSLYGMVLQETWLFCGTIRDNIAYAKPGATIEEITAAAKRAHIHSFIRRLPKGYDTVITEGGGNISEGQKQLLCIARVMLAMPPMLILDEATSSIDTMTEIRIQKAFAEMMKGRTSFIVAHRLSTIRESDIILVMRDGNVIEQGTHEELLSCKGAYFELYNSQFAPK